MKYITIPIDELKSKLDSIKVKYDKILVDLMDDDYSDLLSQRSNLWGKMQILQDLIDNHVIEDSEGSFF